MVARNLATKELTSYTQLLQAPEIEDPEYITLKPGLASCRMSPLPSHHNVYYDLQPMPESSGSTSIYLGNALMPTSSRVHMETAQADSTRECLPAKRKALSFHGGSDFDEDTGDDAKSYRTDDNKKQTHSEIEKRRRDKMNKYITELSGMIPMCHAMSRKLDKLTVLRMAVQHLKTIRGAVHAYIEGHYKPAFISDEELKQLILQAAEGFLFVVGCDRGRILYVSASVSQVLNFSQGDLLGQSWFDILHPKDVAKVKEQLSSSDLSPRERLIDARTMLPVKTEVPQGLSRLCPGARRSFFCRMKCKLAPTIKEEADTTTGCHRKKKQNSDRKYSVIHCTGYLKSWPPAKIGLEEDDGYGEGGSEGFNMSCLVAVGRLLQPPLNTAHHQYKEPPNIRPIQFISRHAMDGKFLFVDQRATLVLGFPPQELLGTSMYEYYHQDDISSLGNAHKTALQARKTIITQEYRFRSKDGSFVQLQSEWKAFKNPWTKEVEYLVAKNTLIRSDLTDSVGSSMRVEKPSHSQNTFDIFSIDSENSAIDCILNVNTTGNGSGEITHIISSHVEASKIGRQIVEEVLDQQKKDSLPGNDILSPGLPQQTPPEIYVPSSASIELEQIDVKPVIQSTNSNSSRCGEVSSFNVVRNNATLSSITNNTAEPDEVIGMIGDAVSPHHNAANDGNDEAAMAVIMSLLEADAGLGGPVDFSGLPWPLP